MKCKRNDPCPCGSGRKYKKCCEEKNPELDRRPGADVLFAEAEGALRQGSWDRAAQLYLEVTNQNPQHAASFHRLGFLAIKLNSPEKGAELIRKAISLDPASPAYHCDFGVSQQRQGRLEDAASAYSEAIRLDPDFEDALANFGGVLINLGRLPEAFSHLEKAVVMNPNHAVAQTNFGVALHKLGRTEEGLEHVRRAAELAPQSADAIRNYASLLHKTNRLKEALVYCERHVALEPDNALACQVLGDCYMSLGRQHEAAAQFWKVLQLQPDSTMAATNLGACLADGGYEEDALTLYHKALELQPDNATIWSNLGEAKRKMGQVVEALACHERAVSLEPENAQAHWNRSLCLLAVGRLIEGWDEYEWRWRGTSDIGVRSFPQPFWDGSNPTGKTILVWMEQGLGDHILLSSLLPDLVHAGAHCIVECDWRLVHLFQRSFPTVEVFAAGNPPNLNTLRPGIDFQIAAGSLPRWFRSTLESFPRHHGFLVPDPKRVAQWKERVSGLGEGPKVGICWRSIKNKEARAKYYSQLNQWGPILTTSGVQFINLQYDNCAEELHEAQRLFGTQVAVWDDMDLKNDQEGGAALIANLDLVISAGTAVAEMAAALAAPTWVLARNTSDWTYLGQDYKPWNPSSHYFFCGELNPWEPIIDRIAADLRKLVYSRVS